MVKKIRSLKVPNISAFLSCQDEESFGDLQGGDDDPEASSYLKGWHNAYILPADFLHYTRHMSFSAAELGVKIIQGFQETMQEGLDCDNDGISVNSTNHHKFLVWLWAAEIGIFAHHPVKEVPDDSDINGRCLEIRGRTTNAEGKPSAKLDLPFHPLEPRRSLGQTTPS